MALGLSEWAEDRQHQMLASSALQNIAKEIKNSRIAALSRAVDKDIDVAAEALKVANAFRIHTFIATSTIHVEHKLKRN